MNHEIMEDLTINKKNIIITSLLLSLLMISAVNAASDINDTLSSDVSDNHITHTNIDKTNNDNNNDNIINKNTNTEKLQSTKYYTNTKNEKKKIINFHQQIKIH